MASTSEELPFPRRVDGDLHKLKRFSRATSVGQKLDCLALINRKSARPARARYRARACETYLVSGEAM